MRVAKFDEARAGRISHLRHTFKDIWRARMLWVTGSVALLGLLGGFIFFNGRSSVPLQSTPPPVPVQAAVAAEPQTQVATTQTATPITIESESPPPAQEVLSAQQPADEACPAEPKSRRSLVKKLLSSLSRTEPPQAGCL